MSLLLILNICQTFFWCFHFCFEQVNSRWFSLLLTLIVIIINFEQVFWNSRLMSLGNSNSQNFEKKKRIYPLKELLGGTWPSANFPLSFFSNLQLYFGIESYPNCFPLTGSTFTVKSGKWLFFKKWFQDAYRKKEIGHFVKINFIRSEGIIISFCTVMLSEALLQSWNF